MKKILSLVVGIVLLFSLTSCGNGGNTNSETNAGSGVSEGGKIGISMPTKSLQRWNQDGSNMKESFEKAGYQVDLQYAGDNDIPTQVSQIENMISGGCNVLVIASIDGGSLTEVLKGAKSKNIPVIAYDRLIMNSDAISYFATFDNKKVGALQAQYILDKLDIENKVGTFNIELFTGAPDDNNVNFFFGGAMEVLKPQIDNGTLVVRSNQTEKAQCATQNWSTEEAQKRMENLITSQGYAPNGTKLDAVYSSNDAVANGIKNALAAAGYTDENMPIITGQDCDITSIKNIIAGTQSMSVFKDTRILAEKVVGMCDSILKGTKPEVNDTESYNNGTRVIPAYLCEPIVVDASNYKDKLVDSGYYTEDQLN